MVNKQQYDNGLRCRGICNFCGENSYCYQRIIEKLNIDDIKQQSKYPTVDKVYLLDNNVMIGVDQSEGENKTCLCFARLVKGKFHIEKFEFIKKQEDIDKYINENKDRWI